MANIHAYLMFSSDLRTRLIELAIEGKPAGLNEFALLMKMDAEVLEQGD